MPSPSNDGTIPKGTEAAVVAAPGIPVSHEKDVSLGGQGTVSEHEGMSPDYPTEEDFRTLRRVYAKIPPKVFAIAFVELCERFSYYGTVVLYTNFITWGLPRAEDGGNPRTGAGGPSPEARSGALGLGQRTSTGIVTFNQFWQYIMPLLGAYVADEWLGRYKTICVALFIGIIGHIILVIAAIPPVIVNAKASLGILILGMIVIGFGTGGFKPNISPLIVEQLPEKHYRVTTLPNGERVIIDPNITINRVYNWFYFMINIGSLVGQICMVYAEKYVGFWLGFFLPTCMLCLAPLVMLYGRKRYVRVPPSGSVLKNAILLFKFAQRGRWSILPWKTHRNMHDGTFWDHAKPSYLRATGQPIPAWMTFDDTFVDELRRGVAACTVFFWYPIYWLTYSQLNNNLVAQAGVLRLNGLPNDILSNLNPLTLIILIPITDFFIYPALRKAKIRFTPIRRITVGFFCGAAAMAYAAGLQAYIYKGNCGNKPVEAISQGRCKFVNINVWIQSPSYILIAISEIFASITALEYAYTKAPKSMRSMVQAIFLFMTAISSALGQAFIALSEDPLLVWNYAVFGVMALVAGCIFWFQFRKLDNMEEQLNELPAAQTTTHAPNDMEANSAAHRNEKHAVA